MFITSFLLLFINHISLAAESFNVDIFDSKDKDNVVVEIEYKECMSSFKIPKKDFYKFSKNDKAILAMKNIAVERALHHCK